VSAWPRVALGDIFTIARGGSPRPIDAFLTDDPDGVNWIMIGDAVGGSKHISSTRKRIRRDGVSRSRMVQPGDLLLTNSMSFGRPYILDTAGCIHDGWLVLSPRSDDIVPDFFYHLLGSATLYEQFSRLAAGAVVKNLNIDLVNSVTVPLPSPSEQRRIAAILDKADAIRRQRKEAIALTEELLRSTFLEMFGDPVSNPKGWQVKPLGEMALQISDGTHKTPVYIDAGVPFLSAKNIRAHRIDWVRTKFISKDEHRELIRRCHPERGDVLLTKSGTIGEAAVVDRDTEFSLFESVALLKLKRDVLSPALVAALLNSPSVRKLYGADVKGVGVKHLHLVDLRKLPTICPPKPVQERYERFENGIRSLLMRAERGCAEADSLFDSLVVRVFSGPFANSRTEMPC